MIAALRIIIFGHQMSPSPHPAQLVQPAPYRLGRNIQAMFELEGLSQRGAAPAGAAPTIARRSGLEQGEQSPLESRPQHSGTHWRQEVALVVVTKSERAIAIRSYDTIDAGARTEQNRGNLGGVATSGTQ